MNDKPIKAAGIIIYRKTDSGKPLFLVVQDAKHGNWGFPKGHLEEGESEIDAALREVQEEIGLSRDDLQIIDGFKKEVEYKLSDGTPKQVTYFLAETDKEELDLSDELQKYSWLLTYEAIGRVTFINNALLINDAREFLMEKEESEQ